MDSPARVAIVTGASRGIGAAVLQRLAKDGFAVVLDYSGDAAGADEVVRRVKDGAEVTFAVMDRVRAEMLRRVGLPDLLVPRH